MSLNVPIDAQRGRLLLAYARQEIATALGAATAESTAAELAAAAGEAWLAVAAATFITLTQRGQLRGCIGSVRARRPLLDDLRSNARAAAFADPRFPPLTAAELPVTRVEVSLLSEPVPIPAASEEATLAGLRPGVDGLILEETMAGMDHQATFLPQVWETLAEPRHFLAELKRKAGLPAGHWSPSLRLQRYTVTKWREAES